MLLLSGQCLMQPAEPVPGTSAAPGSLTTGCDAVPPLLGLAAQWEAFQDQNSCSLHTETPKSFTLALQAFRESLAADVLQPHAQRWGPSFQPPRVQDLTLYSNPHQQPLLFVDDSQAQDCQMQAAVEVRFCGCPKSQCTAVMGRHQLCQHLPGDAFMGGGTESLAPTAGVGPVAVP